MRAIVITGVSSGIGHAATKLFTAEGIKVFGSVRNTQDAERVQAECGPNYLPLLFDVTDEEKIKSAAQFVRQQLQGNTLWGLINNAGIAVPGPLLYMKIADFKKQLDVNLIGQLMVTQAFTPLLGADPTLKGAPGKIINISSVSGKRAFPFMSAYAVSKHGLEAFSEGLRRELMIFGIDVIIVGPGVIKTDIWEKAKKETASPELENSVYRQPVAALKEYMLNMAEKNALPAETIADLLLHILRSTKPKTRYAPVPRKLINWTIPHLLPRRMLDRIIAKKFGLIKKSR